MPHVYEWLLAASVAALLLFEWWTMRMIYFKRLTASQARREQELQTAARLLAQSKQQIKQLQQEVAVLRPLAVRAARHVTQPSPAGKALSQMLDSAPAPARPTLPPDGFADTLPSLQFTNESL
jgi:hypothetical protein